MTYRSLLLISCFTFAACETAPAPPSTDPDMGYIVFIGEEAGGSHVFRQDMDGMNPVGSPVKIYNDTWVDDHKDARYPKVTPDGRYVLFITRKTNGVGTSPRIDDIIVTAYDGSSYNNYFAYDRPSDGLPCQRHNYPEILDYQATGDFIPYKMLVAFTCADNWGNRETIIAPIGMAYDDYFANGGGIAMPGEGYLNGLDKLGPTEFSVHPDYTADGGGYIFSAHNNRITVTEYAHNEPGDDYLGSTLVRISASQSRSGGYCKSGSVIAVPGGSSIPCGIPVPTALRDGYATSISSDGAYLMYNSEAYNNDPSRGEELFVIDLPSTDIIESYTPPSITIGGVTIPGATDPSFVSTIDEMPHINDERSHYGRFAKNGLHQYVMHTREGDGLWVAENLTATPIQIPVPSSISKVREAAWYYKEL